MSDLEATLSQLLELDVDYPGRIHLRDEALRRLGSKPFAQAAVCILFKGTTFLDAEVLLIERGKHVLTHAGQVAFPGGSAEEFEKNDLIQTALRECEEEVGIAQSKVQVLGKLPLFPTLTGNFLVLPVVAYLSDAAHSEIRIQESEVASAEWVSVNELRSTRTYEQHEIYGIAVKAPVFRWGDRKMWGLSAWIFDLLLNRYATL